MTFADFAITEARFRKHFRNAPRDTWNDNMVVLSDFLELSAEDRVGKFPFIWAVNRKQELTRVMVAKTIVDSCEERRDFWLLLKDLAGVEEVQQPQEDVEAKVRKEVVSKIAQGLMKLAGDGELGSLVIDEPVAETNEEAQAETAAAQDTGFWEIDRCPRTRR